MLVYAALFGSQTQENPIKLLGLYRTQEKAVTRCLKEPSYSTFKWIQDSFSENCWHNNLGLYVKVKEYVVE